MNHEHGNCIGIHDCPISLPLIVMTPCKAWFSLARLIVIVEFKGYSEGFLQQLHLLLREFADKVGEHRLGEAHEFITVNATVVLQPFIGSDWHLRGETLVRRVDGCTHNG